MSYVTRILRSSFHVLFSGRKVFTMHVDPNRAAWRPAKPQDPGIPCPACGTQIVITIDALLSQQAVYCTSCSLELRIDWQRSKESLAALGKLHADFTRAHVPAAGHH